MTQKHMTSILRAAMPGADEPSQSWRKQSPTSTKPLLKIQAMLWHIRAWLMLILFWARTIVARPANSF